MTSLKRFFLGFVLLLLGSASIEAMAATCSKSTITGGYGAVLTGISDGIVVDSGGLVTVDGKGNLSGSWTTNANGTVENSEAFTGSYTVNANCAGTATLVFSPTVMAHFNIVVDSANRWDWIETDSGTTQSGYALSVGTTACSEAEIKGTWNWLQMNGYLVGLGPGAFIGMTKFNGKGAVSASNVTENSWHNAVKDFSSRLAATTNRTRCS